MWNKFKKWLVRSFVVRSLIDLYDKATLGFTKKDLTNLDVCLANLILPRLVAYRALTEKTKYYPTGLSLQVWLAMLDEMINSFQWLASEDRWFDEHAEKHAQVKRGLWLFHEYYIHLWI